MSECDICGGNRFELIAKYHTKLIEGTNIESRPEEMAVIDSLLFRCWQMGWLDQLERRDNEFARLKIENHKLEKKAVRLFDKTLDLANENTQLRELLRDTLIQTDQYCDKYGIEYVDRANAWQKANDDIDRRLHELGVIE